MAYVLWVKQKLAEAWVNESPKDCKNVALKGDNREVESEVEKEERRSVLLEDTEQLKSWERIEAELLFGNS